MLFALVVLLAVNAVLVFTQVRQSKRHARHVASLRAEVKSWITTVDALHRKYNPAVTAGTGGGGAAFTASNEVPPNTPLRALPPIGMPGASKSAFLDELEPRDAHMLDTMLQRLGENNER